MNIKQAKEELIHTVRIYLAKDEMGEFKIPPIRQRPIFLMGPPGIGKTQIMEQIAKECKIGLVSYTMTHHTRQSAVGLPFIRERAFKGDAYSVTEYTMSEIIAGVYQKMEETGVEEGILFIDEMNCVSETLAPAMLQFLQCKSFGNQAVPEGWLIVAAGNPPEYNRSAKEFDMVTLDRVRYMPIEADYGVWREYARNRKLHGALLSYLELRPKNFYRTEADVDGMQYVTARGWEDFSCLLSGYEECGLPVGKEVAYEFLHHKDVAEDVAAYLDLYRKYQDDYGIGQILSGCVTPEIYRRIEAAGFDERFSVVHLLLDGLFVKLKETALEKFLTDEFFAFIKSYREECRQAEDIREIYPRKIKELEEDFLKKERAGFLSREESFRCRKLLRLIKEASPSGTIRQDEAAFEAVRPFFERQRSRLEAIEDHALKTLEYAFDFMEQAFEKGEEMVIFVTELTIDQEAAAFLSEQICERYLLYSRQLLAGIRKEELLSELGRL